MKKFLLIILGIIIIVIGIFAAKKFLENRVYKEVYGSSKEEIEYANYKIEHTVNIWLKVGTKESSALALKNLIESQESVKSVEYVSSETALDNFKERKKQENDLYTLQSLVELKTNPFGGTLSITISNTSEKQNLISFINANDHNTIIEKVR